MKRTLAIASSVAMVALAGCSSQIDRKTASGSYEYLKTKEHKTLEVPSELDAPTFSREFAVPDLGQEADKNLVGKSLMVRSPALVLPLVTGSHVEEGKSSATIWFDQVDDSQPLSQAIWNSLLSYLDEQGIGVDSFSVIFKLYCKSRTATGWLSLKKSMALGIALLMKKVKLAGASSSAWT